MLRCISKNLVPVSIKLKPDKSKLSQGARKIIKKQKGNYYKTGLDVSTKQ